MHASVCVGHLTFLHVYLTSKLGHKSLRLAVPGQSKSLCSCVFHLCQGQKQVLEEEDRSKCFVTPSLFTLSSSSLRCEPSEQFWSPKGYGRKGTAMIRCMKWLLCKKSLNKPELQPGECATGRNESIKL